MKLLFLVIGLCAFNPAQAHAPGKECIVYFRCLIQKNRPLEEKKHIEDKLLTVTHNIENKKEFNPSNHTFTVYWRFNDNLSQKMRAKCESHWRAKIGPKDIDTFSIENIVEL